MDEEDLLQEEQEVEFEDFLVDMEDPSYPSEFAIDLESDAGFEFVADFDMGS